MVRAIYATVRRARCALGAELQPHVTLRFASEMEFEAMRDFEVELAEIEHAPFPVAIASVDQFSNGRSRAAVTVAELSKRLDWLHRPHVTLARLPSGGETGQHIAQCIASHGTFRLEPWTGKHFPLYSSRSGPIYTNEGMHTQAF